MSPRETVNDAPQRQPPSDASGEPLRILLVEDVAADAELLLRELRRAGVRCATQRVQSGADLRHALHHFAPDVVLADDALPQFSALDALHVVQRERPLTPVIIVTGSLNEETAVSFIKEGAVDFVVKHRLFRLGPAVQRALALRRALEDAAVAETARHRAEEELRRQTEFLSHAQAAAGIGSWEWDIAGDCITWSDETYRIFGVDPAPVAISTLDADGIVRSWNPAAERLFGWTAEEVIGRPLPAVHGEADEFRGTQRRVMQGEPVTAVEVIRKKKDGTPVTVNLVAAPLHEADGRITGILGLIEDVTGVKRLEQQFFHAQKLEAVGRLAGGIAHDFNNLLTVITSCSDLLLEDLGADDPKREDVAQIRKASESAAALTRQLLAFSRQQVLQPQILDLNETVAGTEKLLKRVIGEDIQLATVLAPDLGMAIVDPGQVE